MARTNKEVVPQILEQSAHVTKQVMEKGIPVIVEEVAETVVKKALTILAEVGKTPGDGGGLLSALGKE